MPAFPSSVKCGAEILDAKTRFPPCTEYFRTSKILWFGHDERCSSLSNSLSFNIDPEFNERKVLSSSPNMEMMELPNGIGAESWARICCQD